MDEICGLKFHFIIFSALDCVFQPTFSRYSSFKDFHSLSRKVGDNLSFKVFFTPSKKEESCQIFVTNKAGGAALWPESKNKCPKI